jgi:hypothetical protein
MVIIRRLCPMGADRLVSAFALPASVLAASPSKRESRLTMGGRGRESRWSSRFIVLPPSDRCPAARTR